MKASPSIGHSEASRLPLAELRERIRDNRFQGQTAGLAPGHTQCNVVILPERWAADFRRYCELNPRPCPLLGVSEPGDPGIAELGGFDIRSDVPLYHVYRSGRLEERRPDIRDLWEDGLVTFALGCSFTFERALLDHGISLRHVEQDTEVPMFRTSIMTERSGDFGGQMVVSMRPIKESQAQLASDLSARFPQSHGAPIHTGDPGEIGIADIERPEYGEPAAVRQGEVPMFWACGVTSQQALLGAGLPLAITHAPGHMLLADALDAGTSYNQPDPSDHPKGGEQ